MSLSRTREIFVLSLGSTGNEVNLALVTRLAKAISEVQAAQHPKALVVTGSGKFFSNGLDLKVFETPAQVPVLVSALNKVLASILTLDCHTIAAINGHAFGAGLFIALACDWRVMRTGRGYLNFPELNLGLSLSEGFAELAKAKLGPAALRLGVLTGKRFNAKEGLQYGYIDREVPEAELQSTAHEMATGLLPTSLKLMRFNPKSFSIMKKELYPSAYAALSGPTKAKL